MSRNLKHSEWPEYICQDLQPVIKWLADEHQLHVVRINFDGKGIYTYIYLDGALTPKITEEAQARFSSNSELNVGQGWIGCARDFSTIEVDEQHGRGEAKKTSLIDRIKEMFK